MSETNEIEISVSVGGADYSAWLDRDVARSDGAPRVAIYRGQEWVGAGWWAGRIDGCDAVLRDDVYDALESAIRAELGGAL